MPRQYITADEFKAKPLGISLRQMETDQIDDFLQVATAAVENYCERIFSEETHVETFRGDGSKTYLTYQYPVVSITSITAKNLSTGDTVTYDTEAVIDTSQNWASGRIEMDGTDDNITSFSTGYLFTVTYVAGFADVPPVVKHGTALWATELMRPDYGGINQATPEIVPMTTEQIIELLSPYRRRRI